MPLGGMRAKNRSQPETKIVKVQLETLKTINIINMLSLSSVGRAQAQDLRPQRLRFANANGLT